MIAMELEACRQLYAEVRIAIGLLNAYVQGGIMTASAIRPWAELDLDAIASHAKAIAFDSTARSPGRKNRFRRI